MHPIDVAHLLLNTAPPDVLMMSRKDMHVRGLDSVVLARDPKNDTLFRMYIATTDILEYNGIVGHPLPLGVHDHKYDITFHLVKGFVMNHTYEAIAGGCTSNRRVRGYTPMQRWQFYPFNDPDGVRATPVSRDFVVPIWSERIGPTPTEMEHVILHTIQATKGSAWIVQERNKRPNKVSNLYTHSSDPPDMSGLYESFRNPQHVVDHARAWLSRNV
jgi:hypothetical protein